MTTYNKYSCRKPERCGKSHDMKNFYYFSHLIPKHHQITDDFIKSCTKARSYFVGIERKCKCLVWASTPKNACLSSFCLIEVLIDKTHGGNFISCQFMIDHYFKVLKLSTNISYNRIPYAMEQLYEKFKMDNPQRFFSTLSRLYNVRHVSQILKKDMVVQQLVPEHFESYNFPRPSKLEDDMEMSIECLNNGKISGICQEDQERFRDLKANAIMMIEVAQKRLSTPNLVDKISKILSNDKTDVQSEKMVKKKSADSNIITNQTEKKIGPLVELTKSGITSKERLSIEIPKEEKSRTISNVSKNSFVVKMGEEGNFIKVPIDENGNLVPLKSSNISDEEWKKLNSLGDLKDLRGFQVEIDPEGSFIKKPVDTEGKAMFSNKSGNQRASRGSSLYTLFEDKEEPTALNIVKSTSKPSKSSEIGVIDHNNLDKLSDVNEIKSNLSVETKTMTSVVSQHLASQDNFRANENEKSNISTEKEVSQIKDFKGYIEIAKESLENPVSDLLKNEKLILSESGVKISKGIESEMSINDGKTKKDQASVSIEEIREKSIRTNKTVSNLTEKTKSDIFENFEKHSNDLPMREFGLTKTHPSSNENIESIKQFSKQVSLSGNAENVPITKSVDIPTEELFVHCISEDQKLTVSLSDAGPQNESLSIKNLKKKSDDFDQLKIEQVLSNTPADKISEITEKEFSKNISTTPSVDLVINEIVKNFELADTKPLLKTQSSAVSGSKHSKIEKVLTNSQTDKVSEITDKEFSQNISAVPSVNLVVNEVVKGFDLADTKPLLKTQSSAVSRSKHSKIEKVLSNSQTDKVSVKTNKELFRNISAEPSVDLVMNEVVKDFNLADTKPLPKTESSAVSRSKHSKIEKLLSNSQTDQISELIPKDLPENIMSTPSLEALTNEAVREFFLVDSKLLSKTESNAIELNPRNIDRVLSNSQTDKLSEQLPKEISHHISATPSFDLISNETGKDFIIADSQPTHNIIPNFEEMFIPTINEKISQEISTKFSLESFPKNVISAKKSQDSRRFSANIPIPISSHKKSASSKISSPSIDNYIPEIRSSKQSDKLKIPVINSTGSDRNYCGSPLDKKITETLIRCADDLSVASDMEISSKHSPLRKLLTKERIPTISHLSSTGSKTSPSHLQKQTPKDVLSAANKKISKASNSSIYGDKKSQISTNSSASKLNEYFFSRRSDIISYTDMNEPGKVKQTGPQYLTDILNDNYASSAERSTESWIIYDTRPRDSQFSLLRTNSQKNDSSKQFEFYSTPVDGFVNKNMSHAKYSKTRKGLEYFDEMAPYDSKNNTDLEGHNRSCSNKFYHTHLSFDFNQVEKEKKIKLDFYQTSDSDKMKSDPIQRKTNFKNNENLVEVALDDCVKGSITSSLKSTKNPIQNENYSPPNELSEKFYVTEQGKESKNKSVQSQIIGEDIFLLSMANTTESLVSESVNYTEIIELKKSSRDANSITSSINNNVDSYQRNIIQIIVDIDVINFDSASGILPETTESVINEEIPERNDSALSEIKLYVTISDQSPLKSTELYTKISLTEIETPEITEKYLIDSRNKNSGGIDNNITSSILNSNIKSHETSNANITNTEISGSTIFSCTTTTRSSETKLMKDLLEPISKHELDLNCQLFGLDNSQAIHFSKTIDSNYEIEQKSFIPGTYQSHIHRPLSNEEWEARFETVLKEIMIKDDN